MNRFLWHACVAGLAIHWFGGGAEAAVQFKEKKDLNPGSVWVSVAGLKPLENPGPEGPDNPVASEWEAPLRFMEEFQTVGDYIQAGDRIYHLIVKANKTRTAIETPVGWVAEDSLVLQPAALLVDHAPARPGETLTSQNGVHRKAMIVYPSDELTIKDAKVEDGRAVVQNMLVAPRHVPDLNARPSAAPFRLFTLFFVYGESGRDKDGFLLLGSQPSFDPDESSLKAPSRVVVGWVPKSRICQWNTREAFEWDRDNTLKSVPADDRRAPHGVVVSKAQDALELLSGRPIQHRIAEGSLNGESVPIPYNRMRFPLLPWEPVTVYDRKQSAEISVKNNRLRRVGVITGLAGVADANYELTERKLDLFENVANRHRAEQQRTEIVFVVDDTASMKDWFPVVAKAIDDIVDLVKRDEQREVWFAVSWYHDDDSGKPGASAVESHPLQDARKFGGEIAALVRKHDADKYGGTALERVYQGIVSAIDAAKFSPYARKMVIVFGDAGNRADGRKDDPAVTDIVDRLVVEGASPIEFYGVQVNGEFTQGAARAFSAEMDQIVRSFRERVDALDARLGVAQDGVKSDLGDFVVFRKSEQKKFMEYLGDRYARLQKLIAENDKVIAQLQSNPSSDMVIGPGIYRDFASRGISKEMLDAIRTMKGFRVFEEGYVWERSPDAKPQIRERVLVNRNDLNALIGILNRLKAPEGFGKTTLEDVLVNAICVKAGEDCSRDEQAKGTAVPDRKAPSLDEVIESLVHIRSVSPLFKLKPQDVRSGTIDTAEFEEVLHRAMLLEDMRDNVRYDYKVVPVKTKDGRVLKLWAREGDPKSDQRSFYFRGDASVPWYWIDSERELP